ncbi:hypothetical protein VTK56DRAFT_5898 [Thermocarpiscus australiensis]
MAGWHAVGRQKFGAAAHEGPFYFRSSLSQSLAPWQPLISARHPTPYSARYSRITVHTFSLITALALQGERSTLSAMSEDRAAALHKGPGEPSRPCCSWPRSMD